jgi:hypothetical protein
MLLMLPVGMRIDACPLHKGGWRLLFISTKALDLMPNVRASSLASQLPQGSSVDAKLVITL